MSGAERLVGAVVAVVLAVAAVGAATPGLDLAPAGLAAGGPSAPTTAPPPTTTTAPGTGDDDGEGGEDEGGEGAEGEDPGGLGGLLPGLDDDVARCLLGDALEDPGALLGEGDITGPATEQVTAIADAVEEERELTFEEEVAPTFVTGDEMEERVRALAGSGYSEQEADVDRRLLAALGAIPADLDLRQTVVDLTAGQVAGYYDPDTGELVVLADDPGRPLGAEEQMTLAHELDHALTDQRVRLPVDEDAPGGDDADLAALALVEGDATVLMQRFAIAHVGAAGLFGAGGPDAGAAQEQLAESPHFLRQQLVFPYLEGLRFVCARESEGGWAAVDAAYRALPATTAEIMFPERYGDAPADPPDPVAPGDGWTEARRDTFGAAPLLWLLEAPGGDQAAALDGARERAAAWGGGEVAAWTNGDATAVGLSLAGRDGDGGTAPALCETVVDWYRASFPDATDAGPAPGEALAVDGEHQDAVLRCDAGTARLGIAPDLATARRIAGA